MTDNIFNDPQSIDTYVRPTWCPGCGNFSIWLALKQSLVEMKFPKENLVMSYDIGCSGNMADFNKVYGFHGLHGRAIPPAVGIKLANHDLKVIVVIGDGGGYGEGLTHFLNEMRGNHDITVIIHDNHRYSLTTGQMSPTTDKGTKTKSTPFGSIETAMNPIAMSLINHATFVAREFAVDVPKLKTTIQKAVAHEGFSVIDVLQPCMVFNPEMDAIWYRKNIVYLENESHSTDNKDEALKHALRKDKLACGIFWQDTASVPYHKQDVTLKKGPLVNHSMENIDIAPLLKSFA